MSDIPQKLRLRGSQDHRARKRWGRNSNPGLHDPRLGTVKPHVPGSTASALLRFDSECIRRLGAEKRGRTEQEFLSRLKDATWIS